MKSEQFTQEIKNVPKFYNKQNGQAKICIKKTNMIISLRAINNLSRNQK